MNPDNKADILFSEPVRLEITVCFETLNTSLKSNLIAPSAEELKKSVKLGPDSLAFLRDSTDVIRTTQELVSPLVNKQNFEADMNAYEMLRGWRDNLWLLYCLSNDTLKLLGSDLFHTALKNYKFIKEAAASQVPGAQIIADKLSVRFEKVAKETEIPEEDLPQ